MAIRTVQVAYQQYRAGDKQVNLATLPLLAAMMLVAARLKSTST